MPKDMTIESVISLTALIFMAIALVGGAICTFFFGWLSIVFGVIAAIVIGLAVGSGAITA